MCVSGSTEPSNGPGSSRSPTRSSPVYYLLAGMPRPCRMLVRLIRLLPAVGFCGPP